MLKQPSIWALALLLGACVPPPPETRDTGPHDAGQPIDTGADSGTPEDVGPADLGVDTGVEDLGTVDMGPIDTGPVDTGVPNHCPDDVNATCMAAATCNADIPPPLNCGYCEPANLALCVQGECETPAVLQAGDLYTIVVPVNPVLPLLQSLAAMALSSRTAGAREITCDDFYAGTVDISDRCYNMLDGRSIAIIQTGDTYTVSLTSFASGEHTLFLIYGFEGDSARGDPVGVSCTEVDVGAPGVGQEFFSGDQMRPI